jgi:hypothetical protein
MKEGYSSERISFDNKKKIGINNIAVNIAIISKMKGAGVYRNEPRSLI